MQNIFSIFRYYNFSHQSSTALRKIKLHGRQPREPYLGLKIPWNYWSYGSVAKKQRTDAKQVGFSYHLSHHVYAHLGPVVQNIVSLTSSLRGQLVKCFTTL